MFKSQKLNWWIYIFSTKGTFHEWTIENQSPGGSAKLGKSALDSMFLGVRVQKGSGGANNTKSAILKTHSMVGFENETVKSLEYFGAHPVSKFSIGKMQIQIYYFDT